MKAGLLLVVAAAVFVGGCNGHAAQHHEANADDICADFSSGAERVSCLEGVAKRTRGDVDQAMKKLRQASVADKRDEFVSMLDKSQIAWRLYSAEQCALEGETSHGGSGTDSLNASCQIRLNQRRLSDLRTAMKLENR